MADETLDQDKKMQFLGRVVTDSGAAFAGLSTAIGARLGLYEAMAGAGPLSSKELAARTGTSERYVREWLAAQVAGQYVHYDPETGTYLLPDEHAAVLADPAAPTYAIGSFLMLKALYATEDALVEAFRTGTGVGWQQHGPELFDGVASFFRPGYAAGLVSEWLPALDGVVAKLERGASVADVGCGYGYSTLLMAQAFPESRFHGYDFHAPSIDRARRLAAEQGLSDRVSFEVATAQDFPGEKHDLITFFDCLHDMPDPLSALQSARAALREEGWVMLVEPISGDMVEDVLNPVGRLFAGASVLICLPSGLSAEPRAGLGNQAGPVKTLALAEQAGFSRVQEATRTPFNIIYGLQR